MRKLPCSRKSTVKRTFWLDPDAYRKLAEIRSKRRSPNLPVWLRRDTFTSILADALHQFVRKHGSQFPRRRRISVSLPRRFALTLRHASTKLHITETDILNMAIREFDESLRRKFDERGVLGGASCMGRARNSIGAYAGGSDLELSKLVRLSVEHRHTAIPLNANPRGEPGLGLM